MKKKTVATTKTPAKKTVAKKATPKVKAIEPKTSAGKKMKKLVKTLPKILAKVKTPAKKVKVEAPKKRVMPAGALGDQQVITQGSRIIAMIGKAASGRFHAGKYNARDADKVRKYAAKNGSAYGWKVVFATPKNEKLIASLPDGKLWDNAKKVFAPFTGEEKYKTLRKSAA